MRRIGYAALAAALLAVHGCGGEGPDVPASVSAMRAAGIDTRHDMANDCLAVATAGDGRFVTRSESGEPVVADVSRDAAVPFFMKPTGLGTYLLFDDERKLLAVDDSGAFPAITRTATPPTASAEWRVSHSSPLGFELTATVSGAGLAAGEGTDELRARPAGDHDGGRFAFLPAEGCERFPEARVNAEGETFRGTRPDGTVRGIADVHMHLMASKRLGGRVIAGESFHRFGIQRALGDGIEAHGADGRQDLLGNFFRGELGTTHDTQGWPTFRDWPVHDTVTHQQIYYKWLERAWKAGLRLAVNHVNADNAVCEAMIITDYPCREMAAVRGQIEAMHELEAYIDAQAGGPGEGWLRIVTTPEQARSVIEQGKLAVVLGVESSNILGCDVYDGVPGCTRGSIDARVAELRELGVRSVFLAHWFDNALTGPALMGTHAVFLNIFNRLQTNNYLEVTKCPASGVSRGVTMQDLPLDLSAILGIENAIVATLDQAQQFGPEPPTYPDGPRCNARGLTDLGAYAVRRLMDAGIVVETDHLSPSARAAVLDIAEARDKPVIAGHWSGGATSPVETQRILDLGGLAMPNAASARTLIDEILDLAERMQDREVVGVGVGIDIGGLNSMPGPRTDSDEQALSYPFTSFRGDVSFRRQRTGERVFDLNDDGVAHYGLFADLFADMEQLEGGERALGVMFRSAEAYLRMWQRASETD